MKTALKICIVVIVLQTLGACTLNAGSGKNQADSSPCEGLEDQTCSELAGIDRNGVREGAVGATISGGGRAGLSNRVTGDYGTVSGGSGNTAGEGSTVSGGAYNAAPYFYSTVGGGTENLASGPEATVGEAIITSPAAGGQRSAEAQLTAPPISMLRSAEVLEILPAIDIQW